MCILLFIFRLNVEFSLFIYFLELWWILYIPYYWWITNVCVIRWHLNSYMKSIVKINVISDKASIPLLFSWWSIYLNKLNLIVFYDSLWKICLNFVRSRKQNYIFLSQQFFTVFIWIFRPSITSQRLWSVLTKYIF